MSEPLATLYNYRFGLTHRISPEEETLILALLQDLAFGTPENGPKGAVFWGLEGEVDVESFEPRYV